MAYVSVIIPAYNAQKTIRDAIRSVQSQTYRDYELIVIDDCSTDDTATIVAALAQGDSRIRILKNEVNCGVSQTRNRGISAAVGCWVAFLDSDDLWEKEKLEKQMAMLARLPDAVICYTGSAFIDSDGHSFSYVMPVKERTSYADLLKKNELSCSSVIVRTDVISQIKMVGDALHEDYVAWLRILKTTAYAYGINEPLMTYRISKRSKSGNRLRSAKMLFRSYRFVGYNLVVASLYVLRYAVYSVKKGAELSVVQCTERADWRDK